MAARPGHAVLGPGARPGHLRRRRRGCPARGLAFTAWGLDLPGGSQLPCGPLEPLWAALTCLAVTCVMCGWTLGFVFPALLLPAAAWSSARLLEAPPPSRGWMQAAVALKTVCWLVVLLTGLVLAFA